MKDFLYKVKPGKAYPFCKVWNNGEKDTFIQFENGTRYNAYCSPVNRRGAGKIFTYLTAPIAPMCLVEWDK
jgi:hypothetical protein